MTREDELDDLLNSMSDHRRLDMIMPRLRKLELEIEQLRNLIDPDILDEEKSN